MALFALDAAGALLLRQLSLEIGDAGPVFSRVLPQGRDAAPQRRDLVFGRVLDGLDYDRLGGRVVAFTLAKGGHPREETTHTPTAQDGGDHRPWDSRERGHGEPPESGSAGWR